MKKTLLSVLFIFSFFIISIAQTDSVWTKMDLNLHLTSGFDDIVELCGKLYMKKGNDLFFSEDQGVSWEFISGGAGSILRKNGIVKKVEYIDITSATTEEGFIRIFSLDCETNTFEQKFEFTYYSYDHGCFTSANLIYKLGRFVTINFKNCMGLAYCGINSSGNGANWILDSYSSNIPDGYATCNYDSVHASITGIVEDIAGSDEKYNFVTQGSNEFLPLENAIDAFYQNDTIHYVDNNGVYHYKTTAEPDWMTTDLNIGTTNSFGQYENSFFVVNETTIYKAEGDFENFTLVPLINSDSLLNKTVSKVDFIQNTFIVQTVEGEVLRFSSEGLSLDNPLVSGYFPFRRIYTNEDKLFLTNNSHFSPKVISNNDILSAENNFKTFENPYRIEHFDGYSLVFLKGLPSATSNYSTNIVGYKSTDGGVVWDSIFATSNSELKFIRKGDNLLINKKNGLKAYSTDYGNTWTNKTLPSDSFENFALDSQGRWITIIDNEVKYSEDFGETWTIIEMPYVNSIFSSGDDVLLSLRTTGLVYKWNSNTLSAELTSDIGIVGSYLSKGFQLNNDFGLVQQVFQDRIYLVGNEPTVAHPINVPFVTTFVYGDPLNPIVEDHPGALDYTIYDNKIYALTDDCVWYADLCDVWTPTYETEEFICEGDFYIFEGDTIYTDTLIHTFTSVYNDCELEQEIQVEMLDSLIFSPSIDWCNVSPYPFFDQEIQESGTYIHHGVNEHGCNEITELAITINPPIEMFLETAICADQIFEIQDTVLIGYGEHIISIEGGDCDSVLYVNLIELEPEYSEVFYEVQVGDLWQGIEFTMETDTIILDTLVNAASTGCDSIIINHFEVLPSSVKHIEYNTSLFDIYPNPAKDLLHIDFKDIPLNSVVSIQIYDALGKQIILNSDISADYSIDVLPLLSGVYFLKMATKEGVFSESFLKVD